VSTTETLFVLDAMNLDKKILEVNDFSNSSSVLLEACYSPDEEYIMIGSEDGFYFFYFKSKKVKYTSGRFLQVKKLPLWKDMQVQ
jgi:hypothetical protein